MRHPHRHNRLQLRRATCLHGANASRPRSESTQEHQASDSTMHHNNTTCEEGRAMQLDEEFGQPEEMVAPPRGSVSTPGKLGVLWPKSGLQDLIRDATQGKKNEERRREGGADHNAQGNRRRSARGPHVLKQRSSKAGEFWWVCTFGSDTRPSHAANRDKSCRFLGCWQTVHELLKAHVRINRIRSSGSQVAGRPVSQRQRKIRNNIACTSPSCFSEPVAPDAYRLEAVVV